MKKRSASVENSEKLKPRYNYVEYIKNWKQYKDHHPLHGIKKALKLNTKEFCLNTSLHGLKFLAYNQLKLLEKYVRNRQQDN